MPTSTSLERRTVLTLEQHADRANAIVWRSASDEDRQAWCDEFRAAVEEGHSQRATAQAFGVAESTARERLVAHPRVSETNAQQDGGDGRARLAPERVRSIRSAIAGSPQEVINSLTQEQLDGLHAAVLDRRFNEGGPRQQVYRSERRAQDPDVARIQMVADAAIRITNMRNECLAENIVITPGLRRMASEVIPPFERTLDRLKEVAEGGEGR